ncbi:elongation factor P [PVC group bacterium (ex Bugula neritina AB1)]|nr:elongation factor P [PVC group bacterium (ex Bugula neritina AB1)]
MTKATAIRRGMVIKHEGNLLLVTGTEHITPGKGNAVMQIFAKDILKNKNIKVRFRSAAEVESVRIEAVAHQYLYTDGSFYHFMNLEDYSSVEVNADFVGDNKYFLIENLEVSISFYEGNVVQMQLPKAINLKVTYAEPWIKGDSVSNNMKPVELETGLQIKVPMFINEGDTIRIDTDTGEYVERL